MIGPMTNTRQHECKARRIVAPTQEVGGHQSALPASGGNCSTTSIEGESRRSSAQKRPQRLALFTHNKQRRICSIRRRLSR